MAEMLLWCLLFVEILDNTEHVLASLFSFYGFIVEFELAGPLKWVPRAVRGDMAAERGLR